MSATPPDARDRNRCSSHDGSRAGRRDCKLPTWTRIRYPEESTLNRLVLLLGLFAVVGGFLVGASAYRASRDLIRQSVYRSNLNLCRTIAASIDDEFAAMNETEAIAAIETIWHSSEALYPKSYLCVIRGDGVLIAHTRRPEKVGQYVGDVSLAPQRPNDPRTVGDLLAARDDWVGANVNHAGQQQVAAYVYHEGLDALLAVHALTKDVDAEVHAAILPWLAALAGIVGVLIPAALIVLHRSCTAALAARRQAEQKLQEQQLALTRVSRLMMLGETVAGVAHQLNQPLAAISNFASASAHQLSDIPGEQGRAARNWNRRIAEQAQRCGDIIRSLKESIQRARPRHEPCDVNELARGAVELVRPEARRLGADIRLELSPTPVVVAADRMQIQHVIVDLLRNAFEQTAESDRNNAQVLLRTRAVTDAVELSVTDDGPTLNPREAESVFDAFLAAQPDGVGWGLAVSRSMIEAHDGKIGARADAAHGMTFYFVVPRGHLLATGA